MPGLSPIKILATLTFTSKMHKLPFDWSQPESGDPQTQYNQDAFQPGEHMGVPEPLCWFWAASTNKYHVKAAKDVGKLYKDFAEAIIDATKFSHDMWKLQAKFKDLKVMAVCAIGTPGCLDGPELESNIKNAPQTASMTDEHMKDLRDAFAAGISKAFKSWQGKVMVPGLPWYPAFAAFPLAQAPPMPNVPMPLITCVSAMMADITVPMKLKGFITDEIDKKDTVDDQLDSLAEAVATVLALAFLMWLPMQQVMLVLGKGPVPTYAPPYVPVGPVVAGDNIAAPGHLMA